MLEVNLQSLKRTRHGGAVIRFVLDSDFAGHVPSEEVLREAARATTEQVAAAGNGAFATQWVRSTQGWAGVLNGWETLNHAEQWFTGFADSFADADGAIVGSRERRRTQNHWRTVLAGHLYLTTADMRRVDSNERGWFWGVNETTTREVCERLSRWVDQPGATAWVAPHAWHSMEAASLDHVESFTEMVLEAPTLRLESALRKPLRYRTALVRPHGLLGIQAVDPTQEWNDQLALVQQLLTWAPQHSDYGYIRHAMGSSLPLDSGRTWPYWPDLTEAAPRYNRPLLASFVPDAHGIQLLTDAHLERAHDLTEWEVTSLGSGRHLVAAHDLEAWFEPIPGHAADDPVVRPTDLLPADPDLIAKARADFGDMIITPDTLEKHNPWT